MDEQIPFEVGYETAKLELLQSINDIADRCHMPSSIMIIILDNIVSDIKLASYTQIMNSMQNTDQQILNPSDEGDDN